MQSLQHLGRAEKAGRVMKNMTSISNMSQAKPKLVCRIIIKEMF